MVIVMQIGMNAPKDFSKEDLEALYYEFEAFTKKLKGAYIRSELFVDGLSYDSYRARQEK